MPKKVEEGNVVKQYYIGNTLVKICDDAYRNRTQEETEEILRRIARKAQEAFSAAALNETP